MITEEFLDAIHSGGTMCAIGCELCGRTHYVNNPHEMGDYEEGELEELEAMHEKEPDKYIPWDCPVSWGCFAGKQAVIGCPCNEEKLKPYEDFIWSHRYMITEYLLARAKSIFDAAQVQDDVIGQLNIVLEKMKKLEYKRVVNREGD